MRHYLPDVSAMFARGHKVVLVDVIDDKELFFLCFLSGPIRVCFALVKRFQQ